jgi:hypothetical protein
MRGIITHDFTHDFVTRGLIEGSLVEGYSLAGDSLEDGSLKVLQRAALAIGNGKWATGE